MKNLLFISRNIPSSGGDVESERTMYFCKLLAKNYGVYLLPSGFEWSDDEKEAAVRKLGVKLIYPRNNCSKQLFNIIFENRIKTVFFGSRDLVPGFYRQLPFFSKVVVDTAGRKSNLVEKTGQVHIRELCQQADVLIVASKKDKQIFKKKCPKKKILLVPFNQSARSTQNISFYETEKKTITMLRGV